MCVCRFFLCQRINKRRADFPVHVQTRCRSQQCVDGVRTSFHIVVFHSPKTYFGFCVHRLKTTEDIRFPARDVEFAAPVVESVGFDVEFAFVDLQHGP